MDVFLLARELFVFCSMSRLPFHVDLILTNESTLLYKPILGYTLLITSVDYAVFCAVSVMILKCTSRGKSAREVMIRETRSLTLLCVTAVIFTGIECGRVHDWSPMTQV